MATCHPFLGIKREERRNRLQDYGSYEVKWAAEWLKVAIYFLPLPGKTSYKRLQNVQPDSALHSVAKAPWSSSPNAARQPLQPPNRSSLHRVDQAIHSFSWRPASTGNGRGRSEGFLESPSNQNERRYLDAKPGVFGSALFISTGAKAEAAVD